MTACDSGHVSCLASGRPIPFPLCVSTRTPSHVFASVAPSDEFLSLISSRCTPKQARRFACSGARVQVCWSGPYSEVTHQAPPSALFFGKGQEGRAFETGVRNDFTYSTILHSWRGEKGGALVDEFGATGGRGSMGQVCERALQERSPAGMRPVIAFLGWLLEAYVTALKRRQAGHRLGSGAAAAGQALSDKEGLPPLSATTCDSAMLALLLRILLKRSAARRIPPCRTPPSLPFLSPYAASRLVEALRLHSCASGPAGEGNACAFAILSVSVSLLVCLAHGGGAAEGTQSRSYVLYLRRLEMVQGKQARGSGKEDRTRKKRRKQEAEESDEAWIALVCGLAHILRLAKAHGEHSIVLRYPPPLLPPAQPFPSLLRSFSCALALVC